MARRTTKKTSRRKKSAKAVKRPARAGKKKVIRVLPVAVLVVGGRYFDGAGFSRSRDKAAGFRNMKHAKRIGRRLANVLKKPVAVHA